MQAHGKRRPRSRSHRVLYAEPVTDDGLRVGLIAIHPPAHQSPFTNRPILLLRTRKLSIIPKRRVGDDHVNLNSVRSGPLLRTGVLPREHQHTKGAD